MYIKTKKQGYRYFMSDPFISIAQSALDLSWQKLTIYGISGFWGSYVGYHETAEANSKIIARNMITGGLIGVCIPAFVFLTPVVIDSVCPKQSVYDFNQEQVKKIVPPSDPFDKTANHAQIYLKSHDLCKAEVCRIVYQSDINQDPDPEKKQQKILQAGGTLTYGYKKNSQGKIDASIPCQLTPAIYKNPKKDVFKRNYYTLYYPLPSECPDSKSLEKKESVAAAAISPSKALPQEKDSLHAKPQKLQKPLAKKTADPKTNDPEKYLAALFTMATCAAGALVGGAMFQGVSLLPSVQHMQASKKSLSKIPSGLTGMALGGSTALVAQQYCMSIIDKEIMGVFSTAALCGGVVGAGVGYALGKYYDDTHPNMQFSKIAGTISGAAVSVALVGFAYH
jgi:hypothetical protein